MTGFFFGTLTSSKRKRKDRCKEKLAGSTTQETARPLPPMKLLNEGNTKTVKGEAFGFRTYGLHLAPSTLSGTKSAIKNNLTPCFRLNLTSDLAWEKIMPLQFILFPHLQFYDYTKIKKRYDRYLDGELPSNYHLTYSRSETTSDEEVHDICSRGGNVAVVFRDYLPATWQGIRVVDGDINDLRFKDPRGIVIGLKAKGTAGKKDETGFALQPSFFSTQLEESI